jgi:transitional endoplasmic reticulum ATPase
MGIRPAKGILLYGPPGTGKTLIAKAVANESRANFISIKGPEIMSKWVGESEKAIRQMFKKAKQVAPAIVFLDEIDAIAPRRGVGSDTNVTERVVNQLLTSMDGLEGLDGVTVIAATNRPDIVDPALLRPGRFDRLILTPIPDTPARRTILRIHTQKMPLRNVDLDYITSKTEGYVGADLENLCREAAMIALREDKDAAIVEARHFEAALKSVRPSVDKDMMKQYETIGKVLETARAGWEGLGLYR